MNVRGLSTLNVNLSRRPSKSVVRYRPTWVEISKSAFGSNVRQIKKFVGPDVELLAVLKADGYGHGATALMPVALSHGATMIGVSSLEEGLELRRADPSAPVLILGGVYPLENFEVALRANLIPTVGSFKASQVLRKIALKLRIKASFHLKVDTGMGRIGVSVREAKTLLNQLKGVGEIDLAGVYSHLASAGESDDFTRAQIKLFDEIKEHARNIGFKNTLFHLANSSATFRHRDAHCDMIRPGLALYGTSIVNVPSDCRLTPVLSWTTKIIFLKKVPPETPISYGRTFITKKESEIATLPVGYADGIPRSVSNKGFVLVRGRRCPIVGRVTMDHLMVDVTHASARVGDLAVLLGEQRQEKITLSDWASWANTIPYEISCGISKRVPREVVS